ncbi:Fic family protein [Cohaesibacter gelatinilyticus]|uniref:Fic family protein n=1 Tax=Cohaesibacter gelatinilyticus TaxID=372072 RepID=A0A285PFJ9_9HYPH|nr:Fic family protein [Cohaesibacter gelatinilyticus]SNZ20083.1 Fic family protein [Cohaesibacter gelatinilyticus]
MTWLWTLPDWPNFTWDAQALAPLEARFLQGSGRLAGTWRHLAESDRLELQVDWLTGEALETSAIEGEILNRDSVQSSVRRQFGLKTDARRSGPAEAGIAEMMVSLYQTYADTLSSDTLFEWHRMIMNGRRDVDHIGEWRSHSEPMQIVSGAIHDPKIHYEAPPSDQMNAEMQAFVVWFNGSDDLPALTRAGIAHFYFVCVHPFEDGNGRVGRALAEKSLAQSLDQPSLIALSQTISKDRKRYYNALHDANHSLEITDFLVRFGELVLDAQQYSELKLIRLIEQTRMFDRLKGKLNARQEKALLRLFRAEPKGFQGGLSSANYRQITGTTIPTASRDLADLVDKGALTKTGEKRYTRYFLNLPDLN